MCHGQIILTVVTGSERLEWPPEVVLGRLAPLAPLGRVCLDPDPRSRPTFADVAAQLERLLSSLH